MFEKVDPIHVRPLVSVRVCIRYMQGLLYMCDSANPVHATPQFSMWECDSDTCKASCLHESAYPGTSLGARLSIWHIHAFHICILHSKNQCDSKVVGFCSHSAHVYLIIFGIGLLGFVA